MCHGGNAKLFSVVHILCLLCFTAMQKTVTIINDNNVVFKIVSRATFISLCN
jgi:hypothetical protein